MKRSLTYKKYWKELTDRYGFRCFYCRQEIASTIDHVVPYDWDGDNSIENLVPACLLCNCLASDKVFEDVEHKRQYILERRKSRKNIRSICVQCLLPFSYRIHGKSIFLCPECDEVENETHYAHTKEWRRWLGELYEAGIPVEAHRIMKTKTEGYKKNIKLEVLIDEYAKFAENDSGFIKAII
jgi:hypothetical protein